MKDSDITGDRDRFDAVWRRVTGESGAGAAKGPDEELACGNTAILRDFMEDEAADMRTYSALASRCSGSARRTLMGLASDERRHLRALRAAYFLETGAAWAPTPSCPVISSVSETLRKQYSGENAGSVAYLDAAKRVSSGSLAELFRQNAADESRHACRLMRLIERLMAQPLM